MLYECDMVQLYIERTMIKMGIKTNDLFIVLMGIKWCIHLTVCCTAYSTVYDFIQLPFALMMLIH